MRSELKFVEIYISNLLLFRHVFVFNNFFRDPSQGVMITAILLRKNVDIG